MDGSIVIGVFNRPGILLWQLKSIARQKINYKIETIVLNDGFKDNGTKEFCDRYKDQLNLRYYFTGQRNKKQLKWRSFCWAVNIGIQASLGKAVIIGCDCIHLNDAVDTLIEPIIKNPGMKIWSQAGVYQDDSNVAFPYTKERRGDISMSNFSDEAAMRKEMKFKPVGYGFFLCGLPRKLLWDMRGWDEDLTGRGYTDTDMRNRLMANKVERVQTAGRAVHLWHPRSDEHYRGMARGGAEVGPNYDIMRKKKKIIVRNEGRKWGIMPPQ